VSIKKEFKELLRAVENRFDDLVGRSGTGAGRNAMRPAAIALVVALVAAAAFTVVRDTRDLEDTAFFVALAISCGGAAIVAAAVARGTARRWLVTARGPRLQPA
jgi:peptidoglycan/LPS O-acetylase OafA/YrhL